MAELSKRPAVQKRPCHAPNPCVTPRSKAADQRLQILEPLTTGYPSDAYRAGRETQVRRENSIATASQVPAPARLPRLTNSTGEETDAKFSASQPLEIAENREEISQTSPLSKGAGEPFPP